MRSGRGRRKQDELGNVVDIRLRMFFINYQILSVNECDDSSYLWNDARSNGENALPLLCLLYKTCFS